MRVHGGKAHLVLEDGERTSWLLIVRGKDGWRWQASRVFREADAELLRMGGASTWAEAYRAGMRAGEHLLSRERP